MRIHYLQHVDFEGPAAIREWGQEWGHGIKGSHLHQGEALPQADAFDLLVVMGGPMSVNDEREFPWLVAEKRLVREAIESGKAVLGVCLGAQMIASAMGARVYRAKEKEIGWFPVRRTTVEGVGAIFPAEFTPLHWHGETFDLPAGAIHIAETEAVPHQAFQLGARAVGLQFHLEATAESLRELVAKAGHEIQAGRFQQSPALILGDSAKISANRPLLHRLLEFLTTA